MEKCIRRSIGMGVVLALLSAGGVFFEPEASASMQEAAAPSWEAGDCFETGDVSKDVIDLSSKVPCSKDHKIQVLSGAKLPVAIAGAGLPALLAATGSARAALEAFANLTCSTAKLVSDVWPKQAALQPLLLKHDVTEIGLPAPGVPGWALPDQASFSAGVQDVLCAYTIDSTVYSKSAGDLRELGTKATLPNFRMCVNYDKNDKASMVSCAKTHRNEMLIYPSLLVTGLPAQVDTWTDANWAKFDAICTDFANVLVGAPRKDVTYIGDVQDYAAAPIGGRRLFVCLAKPANDENALLPAGSIVDLGSKKLAIVKGKSSKKDK